MYVKDCVKNLVRIGGRQGRRDFLRLDMNENPGGLPLEFVEKVKKELTPEYLAAYPEEKELKGLLAKHLGVDTGSLCLTNGSDMAIRYLFEVFAKPGSTVVTVSPSFEMYKVNCWIFGLNHKPVEYHDDFSLDVDEILAAITEDTSIVVLLNPNNPIGTVYSEAEFESIAAKADSVGALVIVDEAYHYFCENTFINKVHFHDNVVVLRTFSKLLSLAGCRMGFIVSNPQIISYIEHVRPSFEVNTVALKFGEMLFQEEGLIPRLISIEKEGRRYLLDSLKESGYETIAKQGNFVFIKPKTSVKQVAEKLEADGILVKTYGYHLIRDYIRVSTGGKEYMERFLDALYMADKE